MSRGECRRGQERRREVTRYLHLKKLERASARPYHLFLLHFLAAAAARILIAALSRSRALSHGDFATAIRIRTAVDFTLFQCHVGLLVRRLKPVRCSE